MVKFTFVFPSTHPNFSALQASQFFRSREQTLTLRETDYEFPNIVGWHFLLLGLIYAGLLGARSIFACANETKNQRRLYNNKLNIFMFELLGSRKDN